MELIKLLIAAIALAAVIGIGVGVMLRAYIGAGSISVLFPEPIPAPAEPPADLESAAMEYFEQGLEAYRSGNYRQALDRLNLAIELASNFAEAYHNRGMTFANLRQDNEAARNLVIASELYAQQGKPEAIALVKQNLEKLKSR
ncbi:MAG: hypothetical protein F6J93_28480 [Oscillatoria sp. SIO1A7]|nr:hypothetical protein [Oscillatoria sp. SIO1A7]